MGDFSYEKLCQRTDSAQLLQTAVPGIELFRAHLFEHQFGKHFHDAYTIGLNQSGVGKCFYKRETHYHYPGSFNCINPGEVHTGAPVANEGWAFWNVCISSTAIQQIVRQLGWSDQSSLPYFSRIVVEDPALHRLFQQLFYSLSEASTQPLDQQFYLLHFFAQLFSRHVQSQPSLSPPKLEHKAIGRIRDYLESRCTEPVSIDELAKLASLNPYYLIRCFHQQIGMPPHSYKKHWQLLKAKQALKKEASLASIATEYGFYDQSHFTRSFKQAFGLTPGKYRTSVLSYKLGLRNI